MLVVVVVAADNCCCCCSLPATSSNDKRCAKVFWPLLLLLLPWFAVCGLAQLPPFNCSTHRCPSVCQRCPSPPQLMTAVCVCWCRTCFVFFSAACCCHQCREWHTTVPQHTTHAHTLIDAFVFFFFFSLFRLSAAATAAEVSHRVTGLCFFPFFVLSLQHRIRQL